MSGIIRDAVDSFGLRINSEGRALTSSISESYDRHENHDHGGVWSYAFEAVNPAGANDKFLYIKNTSTEVEYAITDIRAFASTTVGRMKILTVSGTPTYVTGTDITPASRNTKFNRSPTLTVKHDTDITNLTDDGLQFNMMLSTVDVEEHLKTSSNIIIAPGGAVALEWVPATGELTGIISIVEIESL